MTELVVPFMWREHSGKFQNPKTMETRHLFFVLLMIWNHRMPVDARFTGYKKYYFSPFYTDDYFLDAIRHVTVELGTRKDMLNTWKAQLQVMITYLKEHGNELLT